MQITGAALLWRIEDDKLRGLVALALCLKHRGNPQGKRLGRNAYIVNQAGRGNRMVLTILCSHKKEGETWTFIVTLCLSVSLRNAYIQVSVK